MLKLSYRSVVVALPFMMGKDFLISRKIKFRWLPLFYTLWGIELSYSGNILQFRQKLSQKNI